MLYLDGENVPRGPEVSRWVKADLTDFTCAGYIIVLVKFIVQSYSIFTVEVCKILNIVAWREGSVDPLLTHELFAVKTSNFLGYQGYFSRSLKL